MNLVTLEKLSRLTGKITEKIENLFVRKEDGKGLSTNDYTSTEKEKLSGLSNYNHPGSGVEAGTYRSITVDALGHVTAGNNPTTLAGYGITDAAGKAHQHVSDDIVSLAAEKISGIISLDNLPHGAMERCVVVRDEPARFALTTETAQTGDTVKVKTTGLMYFVVDDTKLSTEEGYEVYTAGAATSTPWSGVQNKPESYPPSEHIHGIEAVTGLQEALDQKVNGDEITELTEADIDLIVAGTFTE